MSSVTTTTAAAETSTTTDSTPISTTQATTTTPSTTSYASTTTTLAPSTSIVTQDPSTSYIPASSTLVPTTVVTQVTSVVTYSNTNPTTQGPIITTITSTQPIVTYTPSATEPTSTSSTSSAGASQSALSPSSSSSKGSGGLSNGATIAIAVIIPIIAVVGFVLFGLWFWRRRKAKKQEEEMRKENMAEYDFNPNNDPTLPVAAAAYVDGGSEGNDDSGYRGWGTTSSANRKPSTTLGSNSRAANGQGFSDSGSQPGGYNTQPSPSAGAASDEPIAHGYDGLVAAGAVGAAGGAGAAGAMAGAPRSRHSAVSSGIHRGASNASSAYSGRVAGSEVSSEAPDMPRPYYQEEVPYNVYESQTAHGPYADGTYGGAGDEPVIRDVQARRNTRIERAPTFPQQGGIAQNF